MKRSLFKKIIFIWSLVGLFSSFSLLASCQPNTTIVQKQNSIQRTYNLLKMHCINIIDGDTIETSSGDKLRFLGIDTPESRKKAVNGTWIQTTGLQHAWALKAKNFLNNLLAKDNYDFYIDKDNIKYDKYNRKVVQLFNLNKQSINLKIVEEGLARVHYISIKKGDYFYTSDYDYYYKLIDAQEKAKKAKSGFYAKKMAVFNIFPIFCS